MKKNKYAKLKRSLLVRFIRWAYRCLDNLFKRKRSTFRPTNRSRRSSQVVNNFNRSTSSDDRPVDLLNRSALLDEHPVERLNRSTPLDEHPVENFNRSTPLDERPNEQLITVGELFRRVKWQSSEQDSQKEIFNVSKISKPHDVSLN
jgi:hypothetical protein